MPAPDVIIVGAQKAGTTALYKYLKQHPKIDGPLYEVHYFDRKCKWKNLDWYFGKFKGKNLNIEKTPNYMYQKKTVKRIHNAAPNAKIIMCLRNPVDRAYSEYWMMDIGGQNIGMTFKEMFKSHWGIRKRGLYKVQYKQFLKAGFKPEQIKIVITEELYTFRQETVNDVFDFIGVYKIPLSDLSMKHVGGQARFKSIKHLTGWLAKHQWHTKNGLVYKGFTGAVLACKLINKKQGYPAMDKILRKKLGIYYSETINYISGLTDSNIKLWWRYD